MNPRNFMGLLIILVISFPAIIYNIFLFFAGWRYADLGWIYKWYIKTDHGRRLEEKTGQKLYFWTY